MSKNKVGNGFLLVFLICSSLLIIPQIQYNEDILGNQAYKPDNESERLKNSSKPSNSDYFNYYKTIIIDHNKVEGTSDLVNFPLLISILDSDLKNDVQANGNDIRFANESDWLDHEIEVFNQSYDDTYAQLVAWVRIPSLSPVTDTLIYMYYGNSTMVTQENPSGVWDNNYEFILHMNQDPSSSDILDSTFNGFDFDVESTGSMTSNDLVDSKIGKGIAFDGVDDYIYLPTSEGFSGPTDQMMFEFWIMFPNGGPSLRDGLAHPATSNGFPHLYFYKDFNFEVETSSTSYIDTDRNFESCIGTWEHIVAIWNGTGAGSHEIYVNGSLESYDSTPLTGTHVSWNTLSLCTEDDPSDGPGGNTIDSGERCLNAILSEFRLSDVIRSEDWIATEYNNQFSPDSFYTIGSEQFVSNIPPNADFFNYYKTFTINHTKVNGNSFLYDFPMLISILDRDLHDDVQPNGNDIAFAKDSIWLNHEIESFNRTYNKTHAELIAWVQIPSLSPNDNTNITMYYGNSTMGARENPAGVWDTYYVMVHHLHEKSGTHYDSTNNDNHGTVSGGLDQDVDGKIDGADDFDGINSHIVIGDSLSLNITEAITIEAWIEDDEVGKRRIVTKGNEIYVLRTNWSGQLHGYIKKEGILYHVSSPEGLLNSGAYHHVALTWDGVSGDNKLRLYHNGFEVGSYETQDTVVDPIDTSDYSLFIGSHGSDEWWDGRIDEVRISVIKRSDEWIATEFNNQEDPTNFYKIGNESLIVKHPTNANYFNFFKTIQVDHTKVNGSSTLSNFPLLISLLDTDLHEYARSNGNDIKFAMNGKWLDHEIEFFNRDHNGTHAQLVCWLEIPSLSPLIDSLIFMYYGNTTISSQENPAGVWESNFKGIWHLSEDPSDPSPQMKDSTINNNHGTAYGTMTSNDLIEGKIGYCLNFDSNDDYINCTDDSSLNMGNGDFTLGMWFNTSQVENPSRLGGKGQPGSGGKRYGLVMGPNSECAPGEIKGEIDDDTTKEYVKSSVRYDDSNWHYVVLVRDGTNLRLYLDGLTETVVEPIGTYGNIDMDCPFFIATLNTPSEYFGGQIDEVRISNISHSADWIATEYNNQYDPNGFYTLSKNFIIGDDIQGPDIQINSPVKFQLFGQTSPAYNVSIEDYSGIDTMWYVLSNGTFETAHTTFTELTGNINQTRWDEIGNGTVTILFYANDTLGNIDYKNVTVRKDIILPFADITNPALDGAQVGGSVISISGMAYDTGSNIVSMYINDTRWGHGSQKPQTDPSGSQSGTFVFNNNTNINPGFYWIEINITDAAGNTNKSVRYFEVIIYDITPPILVISSISPDPTNGYTEINVTSNEDLKSPPLLNITLPNSSVIYRPMILIATLTWRANYTVDANGIYTVRVNGTDLANNVGYATDTFEGDITPPSITINTPNSNDLFGTTAPNYNLTVTDVNIDSIWYSLDGGTTNSTPVSDIGTIEQNMWNSLLNGTVTIRFYANDTLGNTDYEEVTVRIDILAPSIGIKSPNLNDLFGKTAPYYNLTVADMNLDSIWYSLDGGTTNSTPVSDIGTIDQAIWNSLPNGTVMIRFYANDTLGNTDYLEVVVRIDIIAPSIDINSPNTNELHGQYSPSYDISIYDISGIDSMWYILGNETVNTTKTIFTELSGNINQTKWNEMGNGTVTIWFYANDTAGNLDYSKVIVRKLLYEPIININFPTPNHPLNETAPTFSLLISGKNLDKRWYTLDEGITNYTFTGDSVLINQMAWTALLDGTITVKFYLNNTLGLIGFDEVQIIKDTITPQVTINLPFNHTYCGSSPVINVRAYDTNLDSIWYEINSFHITLENNVNQQLDSSIWNSLPEGEFLIFIYVNDTVGHVNNTYILTLYKDITSPSPPILITYPEGYVQGAIIFDWQDGSDFSGISNYRLIIDNEVDPFTTPGFVFEKLIVNVGSNSSYYILEEELESGEYYFFLSQIDGAGHQSNSFSGRFTIGVAPVNPEPFPYWIIIVLIGAIAGLAVGIVVVRRTKKEKVKVVVIDKELDKLKEKRESLELKARSAFKAHDYHQAAELYEECGTISYQLYEEGDKIEESKYKRYKDLEIEAKAYLETISLRIAVLNNLLTKFFDEVNMKYYSDPQIYPENQETVNGLILNDKGFLQIRLTEFEDSSCLRDELGIDHTQLDHINGIQIVYSVDLSIDVIVNYCQNFQNEEMILFIVGLEWPVYNYEETMSIPKDKDIKYPENIKVISLNLFSRTLGLSDEYLTNLNNLIDLEYDLESIKELYESTKTTLHDTDELKNELKQKGWFFLI